MASQSQSSQKGLDITTLPVQQLSQLQQRISQELEHLSNSHARLRAAQARFRDCIRSIKDGVEKKSTGTNKKLDRIISKATLTITLDTPLLIPLTTSLYVPARPNANKSDVVLVDVGTGFYVEKKTPDAIKFYNGKVEDLTKNLSDIEKAVGSKNSDLRMVEEVLREKVLAEQAAQKGGGETSSKDDGQ